MSSPESATTNSDDEWAKCIIIHLTGRPDNPTPMLLKMIADIRADGFNTAKEKCRALAHEYTMETGTASDVERAITYSPKVFP